MKKNDAVFFTTVYPHAVNFLDDFFSSLESQTYKEFDLLIINDGIPSFDTYINKYNKLNIIEYKYSQSPNKNREFGLNKIISFGYKFLIFGDCDDYFSNNRVEKSIEALKDNDIIVNELNIFGSGHETDFFLTKHVIGLKDNMFNIIDGNVFGFSNIAMKATVLPRKISFPEELIALDWYFMSTILLMKKAKVLFHDGIRTYYRQYENNTVGFNLEITDTRLELGVKVKRIHYLKMMNFCKDQSNERFGTIYEQKLNEISDLIQELSKRKFKNKYLQVVNKNIDNFFMGWWSEVISLEIFKSYENKN